MLARRMLGRSIEGAMGVQGSAGAHAVRVIHAGRERSTWRPSCAEAALANERAAATEASPHRDCCASHRH